MVTVGFREGVTWERALKKLKTWRAGEEPGRCSGDEQTWSKNAGSCPDDRYHKEDRETAGRPRRTLHQYLSWASDEPEIGLRRARASPRISERLVGVL